ncbi:MAG: hypothetical protein CMM47_08460 [Rhodospirillaceae bacterium]|nr:hypothetical protein [Rhodospirillaceae bacterium]
MATPTRHYFEPLAAGLPGTGQSSFTFNISGAFTADTRICYAVRSDHSAKSIISKINITCDMLTTKYLPSIFGTIAPSDNRIKLCHNLRSKRPVRPSQVVATLLEMIEIFEAKSWMLFETTCTFASNAVRDVNHTVMVPSRTRQG